MKKYIQFDRSESFGSESDDGGRAPNQSLLIPPKFITTADSFERREQSWYANCQIPTDLSIQVQDVTFHVHKYPLISKCEYLCRVEFEPPNSNAAYDHKIEKLPGGPETFEIILKFCYGLQICLNPNNIAALRCASEFLEMNESQEGGNLISKSESFFTFVVLSSWKDTITVLKSCEALSPWAENLQIVRRCCDSVAWKICQENEIVNENEERWWFEDVGVLRIDHFLRIIASVRVKGMKPEMIGSCIVFYGEKWLTSVENEVEGKYGNGRNELKWNIVSGVRQERGIGQNKEQRIIIESLISALPPQREAVSCKFLLRMLKMAMVYSASPALISELEKRVGMVLENASVLDLLIPSYFTTDQGIPMNQTEEQTIHNIDVVQRILEYFLMYEHQRLQQEEQKSSTTLTISKLVDNYLAEIARDPNLSITRFQVLAEFFPRNSRTCDDGLYRAIDIYLKSHPSLSEHDRRRLCKVIDCEKLSLDACMHAAQNERLPLRIVIQILFAEQVKIRASMQKKDDETSSDDNNSDKGSSWPSTKKEIKTVKEELDKLKEQMAELQRDYSELQQEYEKVNKHKNFAIWANGWKKIKRASFFIGKFDAEEGDEGQNRNNQRRRSNIRRRQSVS